MRIRPQEVPRGRVWSLATDRYLALGGWTEKVPGKGEDAEPTWRAHESGRGLIGVYDGTGGAGAGVARRLGDGTELSGAYVGSRLTKEVLETWFTRSVDRSEPLSEERLAALSRLMKGALVDEAANADQPEAGGMVLKGSLKRLLPTTLAAVAFEEMAEGIVADALWAGDSRCYALTPGRGLQVLSVDDTRDVDALSLIRNDQPMENLVSADRDFTIHRTRYQLHRPVVLLTATDGCFGYVHTPAHFEHLLLDSLDHATDLVSWGADLVQRLDGIAGDDVSFSLVAYGFCSFPAMQVAMRPRRGYLIAEHWSPFANVGDDREQFEAMRDASWHAYRDDYHELILQADGAP